MMAELNIKNASVLANMLGINPQVFYDINSGKCGISQNVVDKIVDKFPTVSRDWLLTGMGDVIISGDAGAVSQSQGVVTVTGKSGNINNGLTQEMQIKLLDEIKAQRMVTERAQVALERNQAHLTASQSEVKTCQEQITTLLELLKKE
ncbi:MAG: hypothetical protein MJ197_03645 [Bacteroidales bacterium]|nr:hypothetical protein [Bacteroidales bacterium]